MDTAYDTAHYGDTLINSASDLCRVNSFSADTEVATDEGDTSISLIEIGDYVLAWDESTDTLGWYQVTDTIHHTDDVVVHLTIDGETLETTPEHPFYVEGKGWVDAENLQVGDKIRKADGSTGEVESIETEETSQEMYNLTVDEAHTFFVGDGQWLVHNNCPVRFPMVEQLGNSLKPSSYGEFLAIQQVSRSPYNDMQVHIPNVYSYATSMAMELGYSGRWLDRFEIGVFTHDIGKGHSGIVDVFNSSGAITDTIRQQAHVWTGGWGLANLGVTDPMILEMALWHHPGYPGIPHPKNMPDYVQILHAADVYGAIRETRGYKVDKGHDAAMMAVERLAREGYIGDWVYNSLARLTDLSYYIP